MILTRLTPPSIPTMTHAGPIQSTTARNEFPNLAGKPGTPTADRAAPTVQEELETAGIPTIPAFANPNYNEVMANHLGVLRYPGATFVVKRLWYYYSVTGTARLPYANSRELNRQAGPVVRIDGLAGGVKRPTPYTGVGRWHIDTNSGLKVLVQALNAYFGKPEANPGVTVAELETTRDFSNSNNTFYGFLIGANSYVSPFDYDSTP